MRIYFIDEKGKNLCIKKIIEDEGIQNIEHKENLKFRINKTDIVITTDFKNNYDDYKKVNQLIIITRSSDKNEIWNMTEKLNTIDIIFDDLKNSEYIGKRIAKILR